MKMAKTPVLLIAFLLYQISSNQGHPVDDSSDESAEVKAECAKELGIPEELIEKLEEDESLYSVENNRCYVKCVFEKSGIIDEEGKYNAQAFQEVFEDIQDVKKHLPQCEKLHEEVDNMCDKAWMVFECLNGEK